MEQGTKHIQPTKGKYIGAFLLANFLANLLSYGADYPVSSMFINDHHVSLNGYFITSSLVSIFVLSGSFIVIYNLFSSLNVRKAMPWIIGLLTLGTLSGLGRTLAQFLRDGIDPTFYVVGTIVSLVASLFIIQGHFSKKPDRWFKDIPQDK